MIGQGKYVRMVKMVKATGASPATIKKWSKEGRIKSIETEGGTRYLLPEKQIAYSVGAAKRLKENEMTEEQGKLITIMEYIKKTGLPNSTTYQAVKDGWLDTEIDDDGKRCIRWFNKTTNLLKFQEARANHLGKEIKVVEDKTHDENREKSKSVMIGSLIPPRMWAGLVGYSYQSMQRNLADNVFDDCSLKVQQFGNGEQRRRCVIEWPGYDRAVAICTILKKRMPPIEKKYHLNQLCNSIDEAPVVEEPEVIEPVVEEPIAVEPEVIEPEQPVVAQSLNGSHNEDRIKTLETQVNNLEKQVKKLILAASGF